MSKKYLHKKTDFDTSYDFRIDCGGVDPDYGSPTLRRYHRILWSKQLPNGKEMKLTHDNGGYLKWNNYEFGSDAMINGMLFARAERTVNELKLTLNDFDAFIEDYKHRSWMIGGEIIFPKHENSMNQLRGTSPYIMDRWDLTMECIRRFYLGKDSPLYEVLNRDRDFYSLFVDFRGYVDFFFLQDCVSPGYDEVIFWNDDCSLDHTMPLPKTASEHLAWIERSLQFVEKRAERMQHAIENDVAYSDVKLCLTEEDLKYHYPDNEDEYYEILDEVVDMFKRDDSLVVSTKHLRATRYANGYARYIRINDFGCGILFDKENWMDSEYIETPFWLAIYDANWELSAKIRTWFDKQNPQSVSRKWKNQPCMALLPPVNASFHQVCEELVEQIITTLREIHKYNY